MEQNNIIDIIDMLTSKTAIFYTEEICAAIKKIENARLKHLIGNLEMVYHLINNYELEGAESILDSAQALWAGTTEDFGKGVTRAIDRAFERAKYKLWCAKETDSDNLFAAGTVLEHLGFGKEIDHEMISYADGDIQIFLFGALRVRKLMREQRWDEAERLFGDIKPSCPHSSDVVYTCTEIMDTLQAGFDHEPRL